MSALETLRATIPHFGIPKAELTAAQRRERATAVNRLTAAEREDYDREVGRLHALRQYGTERRSDARFLDPDAERYALEELRARGLDRDSNGDPLTGQRLRRKAKSWLMARADAIAEHASGSGQPTADDVLMAFHEAEALRWREVARLERARARQHEALAAEHETALVEIMRQAERS